MTMAQVQSEKRRDEAEATLAKIADEIEGVGTDLWWGIHDRLRKKGIPAELASSVATECYMHFGKRTEELVKAGRAAPSV